MGILRDAIRRDGRRERTAPAVAAPPPPVAEAGPAAAARPPRGAAGQAPAGATPGESSQLRRRRDTLAEQVTEMHWDLGGLAYEMAIRDHFRLDVLVRRAALLQERDAELAEIERLLRMEEAGAAGSCPSCGAPHSRGALFCWQCGRTLMERVPHAAAQPHAPDGATVELDALLRPATTGDHPPGEADERAQRGDGTQPR